MSDKEEEPSHFSFRMFDMYRRFVEILQYNLEFLEEFKNGEPKEETCRIIIKKIFQLRQSEEKIASLIKYLTKNAKLIAFHAENIPNNWSEAILYTDTCIKQIRKYLRRKNISMKSDLDSIKELAKDIGEHLHNPPSEKQIEAIREYLKYDIRNPKKNITSPIVSKKSKSKVPKSTKTPDDSKTSDAVQIKKDNLNNLIKKLQYEPEIINEMEKVTDKQEDNYITAKITNIEEELYKMGEGEKESSVDSAQDSVEELYQKQNFNDLSEEAVANPDKLKDPEYIKSVLKDSENVEIDERPEKTVETLTENHEIINSNDSVFDYCYGLKRKNSNCIEDDGQNCAKKFISDNMQKAQEMSISDEFITISYNNDNKNGEYEVIQIPVSGVPYNLSIHNEDENNSEFSIINVMDDEENSETKPKIENLNIQVIEDIAASPFNGTKDKMPIISDNNFNWKESYNPESDVKYANVVNMTYTEVLKLIETVMAFCELRNEISLEEFLILRRTRDKMQWKSLKEI